MTDDSPTSDDLPAALIAEPQWVCWREQNREGKTTKVPVDPATGEYASTIDPDTWATFEDAVEYARAADATGIGFVCTVDSLFVGVDLDDCRDPEAETTEQWAMTIIERLDSYTEISPSGTGYHVLTRGTLPGGRNRHGEIELYETARFFTVTGDRVGGQRAIRERTEALASIHAEHIRPNDSQSGSGPAMQDRGDGNPTSSASYRQGTPTLSDDDLLARARTAANRAKFQRLWRGDTSGYDSQSEADMALAVCWRSGRVTTERN